MSRVMPGWARIRHSHPNWRAVAAGCAYCHNLDAFAWGVVGSVAGVVGAAAAVVSGLLPLLRDRQARKEIPPVPAAGEGGAPVAGDGGDVPVVVGEVPQEPVAFQPRAGLLAGLDGRVCPGGWRWCGR